MVPRRLAPRVIPTCAELPVEPPTLPIGENQGFARVRGHRGCRDLQQTDAILSARKREARVVNHRVATLDTRHYSLDTFSLSFCLSPG